MVIFRSHVRSGKICRLRWLWHWHGTGFEGPDNLVCYYWICSGCWYTGSLEGTSSDREFTIQLQKTLTPLECLLKYAHAKIQWRLIRDYFPTLQKVILGPSQFPITSAHLRLVRVRTNSHHTRRTGADRWQELNLSAKTAKRPWGYPDSWMVYFISNPKQKWMGCIPPF